MTHSLFNELKRRNVFRVAIAYLLSAWAVAQVADLVLSTIQAPSWVMKALLLLMGFGFIVSIIVSWAYEITPEGVKKESEVDRSQSITNITAKKLDIISIFAVVLVGLIVVWQKYQPASQGQPAETSGSSDTTSTEKAKSNQNIKQAPIKNDKSIAVLPFTNRSVNQEDVFFADGMHDDLLTKLAKSHQLRVISRTSVEEYRGTTKKIPEIAKELGVHNILEGGVQRAGTHIRINAQLINATTDEHLWAETYDRELNVNNMFAIQTEITKAIAKALEATLTPAEKQQINKPQTDNLLAWQANQQALKIFFSSTSVNSTKKAIAQFHKAIELDPKYAAAYANLAVFEMNDYWFNGSSPQQRQRAWRAIEASRALDDNSVELFVAEASYYYWGFRDFAKALYSINKAIAISPNYPLALSLRGYLLRRLGRFDESIAALEEAASVNPLSMIQQQENAETSVNLLRYKDTSRYIEKASKINNEGDHLDNIRGMLALNRDGDVNAAIAYFSVDKDDYIGSAGGYWWSLLAAGKIEQSIEFAKSSTQLVSSGPYFASPDQMMGLSYFVKGDKTQTSKYLTLSLKQLDALIAKDSENKNYLVALCNTHAALKNAKQAEKYCQKALTKTNDLYDYPFDLVSIVEAYAMLGEDNKALGLLQRSLEFEVRYSAKYFRLDPFLKNLQKDPRFEPLIQRIDSGELVKSGDNQ